LLIADHMATRLGVRMALADCVHVCAEAGDADQAISAALREQPDVCVVGLEIPGGGLLAVAGIRAAAPSAAVVVLTPTADVDDMLASVRAGAIGYLPGSIEPLPFRRAVVAAAAGEAALPRGMVIELVREVQGTTSNGDDGLTQREAQVLGMLRRGQPTSAIADRLSISPVTVRRHISALVHKTGVEDRAALATPTIRSAFVASEGDSAPGSIGALG
jgi:DNA-binding NarL/FixJ family response regulator